MEEKSTVHEDMYCMQDRCGGMSTPSSTMSAVVSIRFVDGQIKKFFGFVHFVTTTVKPLLKSRVDALTENEIWIIKFHYV